MELALIPFCSSALSPPFEVQVLQTDVNLEFMVLVLHSNGKLARQPYLLTNMVGWLQLGREPS